MDSERYVLACYRYIELNPVRAAMVAAAGDYDWSSHAANAFGRHDPLVCMHPVYRRLAPDQPTRCERYRELMVQGIAQDDTEAIRLYVQRQRALGSHRFQQTIEQQLGRRAGLGKPGRPRKSSMGPCIC